MKKFRVPIELFYNILYVKRFEFFNRTFQKHDLAECGFDFSWSNILDVLHDACYTCH